MSVKFGKDRFSLHFMNSDISIHKDILALTKSLAEKRGLLFFGVADLNVTQDYAWYEQWIEEGRHAGMDYLARNLPVRANPSLLLDNAKTAWVFGLPYYLGDRWQRGDTNARPKIAMYARIKDYHKILKTELDALFSELLNVIGFDDSLTPQYRVTVDSVPLLERALAANTKAGFIGKNTCVIHPKRGSFFLLGEVISTWNPEIASSAATPALETRHRERTSDGGCGSCKRCQVHCPTGALDRDYQIDARKCLSWWTIENRGLIPKEFWPWIGRYVFGCDICQLVCPWNRGVEVSKLAERHLRIPADVDLLSVATMTQAVYEQMFGGTPATRAKREGLIRNALIAMHVRGDNRLQHAFDILATEPAEVILGTILAIREDLVESKVN